MTLIAQDRPDTGQQQRQHLRFPVSWAAEIRLAGAQALPARVINVSQGGVGVLSDDVLPAGHALDLLVRVPSPSTGTPARALAARARVVHQVFSSGRNRAGLQFVDIASQDAKWLVHMANRAG